MRTTEYVRAVHRHLPRWLPGREQMVLDLRSHLADRLAGGEAEAAVLAQLEPPEEYAAALVSEVPLDPAPVWRRVAAFVVDALIGTPLVVLGFVGSIRLMTLLFPAYPADMATQWLQSMLGLVGMAWWVPLALFAAFLMSSALVLSVVYFPVAEAVWGTTVGKRLLGLCVAAENGTRVTWGKAIVRRIPFFFEFFWLDALFALFTKRRQRAFDHVARTLVVRCPAP